MAAATRASAPRLTALKTCESRHPPFRPKAYPFGQPADECPECGSAKMCWVTNKNLESRYLCEACGRCWAMDAAGAVRVSPLGCPGCGYRQACFVQLSQEIPPWWWVSTDQ
jgi:hypothetical protein